MSSARELAKHDQVLESVLFYNEGESIDNYGPKPYLVRYYLAADSRKELDDTTQYFFDNLHITATDGSDVNMAFILCKD